MPKNQPKSLPELSGSQRLHLKQMLSEIVDQLVDQQTQIEQTISQGLPDLAVGLSSAGKMRELETMLRELSSSQGNYRKELAKEALTSAAAMSWREERSWAQAREQALEKGVANLLQAAWLGTALKRQAVLTEGLTVVKGLLDHKEDGVSEEDH